MRVLLKASIPVEVGNQAAREGKLAETVQSILDEQKPEAVYFLAENGTRTALVFLDLESAAQLPKVAEPWFLAFNARIEVTPAFTPEELPAVGADIEQAVEKYS
ncbi:MAG: hypothetical protein ACE5MK_12735 [Acidobacteriota bacterium]